MLIPFQIPNSQSDEVFFKNAGKAVNNGIDFSLNLLLNSDNYLILLFILIIWISSTLI